VPAEQADAGDHEQHAEHGPQEAADVGVLPTSGSYGQLFV
jgi:hypothetical protein